MRTLPADTRASRDGIANMSQHTEFKSLIGQALFVGRVSQPILLRIASQMAAKTAKLHQHHLKDLTSLVKYAKKSAHSICFRSIKTPKRFGIEISCDASMGSKKDEAARSGFVIFRRCGEVVHPLHWSSRKLRELHVALRRLRYWQQRKRRTLQSTFENPRRANVHAGH
eukprot:IDg3915t1